MSIEVRLPQWGMGMQEGTILQWLKAVGESVTEGEVLAEVESAKAVDDLLAPADGRLAQIVVAAGETVPVNEVLAMLEPIGDAGDPQPAAAPTQTPEAAIAPEGVQSAPSVPPQSAAAPQTGSAWVRNVVPRARAIARSAGIDLHQVTGTGPEGRILVSDVEAFLAGSAAGSDAGAAVAPAPASVPAAAQPEPGAGAPMSSMRRTIARRMVESLQTTAQLTLIRSIDVTAADAVRRSIAKPVRPSFTDIFLRACSLALREHPQVNSWIDGDRLIRRETIDIGFAVAVDGGLLVPVVSNVDTLSIEQIATSTRALAQQARERRIDAGALEGGGFSVSSLGGQGIDAFTPVLNPPEAAILGLGRTSEKPIRYGSGLAWRTELTASLTIDHRIVDGAPGAAFLQTIADIVSDSDRLFG
ncbi:MAG TPA: dihydrolipoamide acetyltransferase family protein [Solirubrobacteraceae bacterium]|jgi:pyruvate dehydrogenase E2 component (dihydrolipoyllysine-residue acetyltransferase)|nr:dihydrolipoamide acetyltransferase family protein [Solirubrobacteraceae bacterium]